MSDYVLFFRSQADRSITVAEEAAWGGWFQQIGSSIVDFGGRVGRVSSLGNTTGDAGAASAVLSGYITIQAEDLESAVGVAKGCPGLSQGGGVEVGEIVTMT